MTAVWALRGNDASTNKQIPILMKLSSVDHDNDDTTPVVTQFDKYFYVEGSLPGGDHSDTRLLANNDEFGVPCMTPYQSREASEGEERFMLPDADGDATGIMVDLPSRTLDVQPGLTLEVEGSFTAASWENADIVTDEDGTVLGGGVREQERPVKLNLGSPTPGGARSTIKAEGSITIEGVVQGKGSLVADENVVLQPSRVDIESDVQSDLAVYGQNVIIKSTDSDAVESTVSFKGLVYAEKNFYMFSNANLEVEGALVARTGHVYLLAGTADVGPPPEYTVTNFNSGKNLKVTYNPNYLDSLLNSSTQERTKVELLAWRPGRDQ